MLALEPQLEDLLLRIVPDLARDCVGATPDEIDQIERIAGQPLPNCYRWFLTRMGRSMGGLTYSHVDFSSTKVIDCYRKGIVAPDPEFLLIGYFAHESMPLHYYYDFGHQGREDAAIVRMQSMGDEVFEEFESLREMLAWISVFRFRVGLMPQRCIGWFEDESSAVYSHLEPALRDLGFSKPIETGPFCGVFERDDAALVCSSQPSDTPDEFQTFHLGAVNSGTIRRILGTIASETSLRVKIRSWDPALP